MTKLIGVLIDTYGDGRASVKTIEDEITVYHELLDCRCIDITVVKLEGINGTFDIIHDDEFLFSHGAEPLPSVYINGKPGLFGNVFICRADVNHGKEVSLTPNECYAVLQRLQTYRIEYKGGRSAVLDILQARYPNNKEMTEVLENGES